MIRLIYLVTIVILLVANLFMATTVLAHPRGSWHWDVYGIGAPIDVKNWVSGSDRWAAEDAIDDWDGNTILNLAGWGSGDQLDVEDFDYGDTPWIIKSEILIHDGPHIKWAKVTFNSYYSGALFYEEKQGYFCRHIGHLLGLAYSFDGCMGWPDTGVYYTVPHNWYDIEDMYLYSHHPTPTATSTPGPPTLTHTPTATFTPGPPPTPTKWSPPCDPPDCSP